MSETAQELEVQTRREQLVGCFGVDSRIVESISTVPPELMLKDETELSKLFRPTPLDFAMKKNLWLKFYECEKLGVYKLKATDVYDGFCSNPYFYQQYIVNPARMAWLFCPPINTDALIEEAFRFSFDKVRDGILNMPVTEKSAPIILKAFQYFADRHLGPMIQRLETKNLNVEVDGGKMLQGPVDPYEIDAKLRELKDKLLPAKDVTPKNE